MDEVRERPYSAKFILFPRLDSARGRAAMCKTLFYITLHEVESAWWIILAASSCRVGGGDGDSMVAKGRSNMRGIAVGGIAVRVHYPLELSRV